MVLLSLRIAGVRNHMLDIHDCVNVRRMCNNNMSVMREYSLALYLMTMFGEGYKVC